MKRGLKLFPEEVKEEVLPDVGEASPMKRGLKRDFDSLNTGEDSEATHSLPSIHLYASRQHEGFPLKAQTQKAAGINPSSQPLMFRVGRLPLN